MGTERTDNLNEDRQAIFKFSDANYVMPQNLLGRLYRDRKGGIIVSFGLGAPVIALGMAGTVEYTMLMSRRAQLQSAADSAVLAATQQLRLSNNSDTVVIAVARKLVTSYAGEKDGAQMTVDGTVGDKRTSVALSIKETVPGVFGKLFALPTMELGVKAKARLSGTTKLCLLALDETKGKVLNVDKDSRVTAAGCSVYSNSDDKKGISIEQNARVTASQICSAGGVEQKNGALLIPTASTDCPKISDPLAGLQRPTVGVCTQLSLKITTTRTLSPGTYCGGLEITGNGNVTLFPGVYVMHDGPLVVSGSAKLTGVGAGFFFTGSRGGMRLDPDTSISLSAPTSGDMAGLLMFEDRSVSAVLPLPPGPKGLLPPPPSGSLPMRNYQISSNDAPNLLGTIYLPAGRLVIDAAKAVADRSAYTVIVARQLELNSGPDLVLNSDYAGSSVPVPQGVGSNSGNVSLSQ